MIRKNVGIYGEQVILVQYLPHISDVVSLCKRSKMTISLESGLIGCVTLLKYLMSYFTKSTLNEIGQVCIIVYGMNI